jgi:tetratricopeptide (TPR) repeat protein
MLTFVITRGLQYEQQHAPLHFLLGNALAAIGDHASAVKAFEDTIKLEDDAASCDPDNFLNPSLFNLANSLDSLGHTKKAEEMRKRGLDLDPNFLPGLLGHASHAIQQEDFDGALQICEKILAKDRHCFGAHATMGKALMCKQQFHEAIASFKTAKEIKPECLMLYSDLAGCHIDVGDYNAALAMYSEGAALPLPDFATEHDISLLSNCAFNQGQVLSMMGNHFAAIDAYQRAIEINPGYLKAHMALGNSFSQIGRLDDAAASLRTAFAIMPERPEPMIQLGTLLLQQKDFVAAKAALESARTAAAALGDGESLEYIAQCMRTVHAHADE